jgi:glycosyltransferase involved in cell wall biosynthesis
MVSVLMSVYNGERYLAEAVESILRQTFTDFEFIVINDGSSDDSADILSQYELLDKRLHVFHQENRGLIASLNRGIGLAKGKYLARMDADDISLPDRLRRQVEVLEEHPDLVIVGTARYMIDETGNRTGVSYPFVTDTGIRWGLLFGSSFVHSTVMLRADILRQQGLSYDVDAFCVEDYDLWSRLMRFGRGYNIPELLQEYRYHTGQITQLERVRNEGGSDRIAWENISRLSISVSLAQVRNLRRIYSGVSGPVNDELLETFRLLFQVLERFEQQPGVERRATHLIRRHWIDRVVQACFPGQLMVLWRSGLLSGLYRSAAPAMISALPRLAYRSLRARLGRGIEGSYDIVG